MSLRRRLFALSFLDEVGPVYTLITLWFVDRGVSLEQISTVFVVWAVAAILLEIPSGAIADRHDKRVVVGVAFALRAVGTGIWFVAPDVGGLLAGTLLWAMHDALASGAWEALIHDELTAVDEQDDYGPVMARVGQASNVGVVVGTVVAIPVIQSGAGIEVVVWLTVGINLVTVALVLRLPDVRWVTSAGDGFDHPTSLVLPGVPSPPTGPPPLVGSESAPRSRAETPTGRDTGIRAAFADVRRVRFAPALLGLGSLIGGVAIIDEFVPLLARHRGASDAVVLVVFLIVWLGLVIGGEIAARRPDLSPGTLATLLLAGGAASVVGVLTEPVLLIGSIAVGYAAIEATWVIADARLQARIPTATRATVTSIRGVGEGLLAGVALGVVGLLGSRDDDPTAGMLVIAIALTATGLVARWSIPPVSRTAPAAPVAPAPPNPAPDPKSDGFVPPSGTDPSENG